MLFEALQEGVMKRLTHAAAVCPFYQFYERHKIVCEGVQEDSNLHMTFSNPDDRKDYHDAMCCGDYKKCRVAKMLYQKWGEDV